MIERAQQKAIRAGVEVTFQVDLVENMTFPDNQFEVVLSSLMMRPEETYCSICMLIYSKPVRMTIIWRKQHLGLL